MLRAQPGSRGHVGPLRKFCHRAIFFSEDQDELRSILPSQISGGKGPHGHGWDSIRTQSIPPFSSNQTTSSTRTQVGYCFEVRRTPRRKLRGNLRADPCWIEVTHKCVREGRLFPTHPIRSTDAAQHAYYTTTLTPPQPVPALSVRERVRRPPLAYHGTTHRAACVHPPRKNATPSHPPRTHHSLADPRRWLRQLRARAARPFAARAFHRQQHRTGPAAASSAARARQILFPRPRKSA